MTEVVTVLETDDSVELLSLGQPNICNGIKIRAILFLIPLYIVLMETVM